MDEGPETVAIVPTAIDPRAMVSDDAAVATGVSVAAGAFVGAGASLGEGATIGPNATVTAGVQVGVGAEVAAGAVATTDVPPFAIAQGNPAHIVGYRSTSRYQADRRLRASTLDDDAFPLVLGRATLAKHPLVEDLRGSLSFGEVGAHLPFDPVRYFLVYGVPGPEVRGEHAHRQSHQLLVCVHGECSVMVNDGTERAEVVLDRPDVSLHLPPMIWAAQFHYSPDAVLMVLCSRVYEADDYIRDYDEFERALGAR
ncbi:MAG: WxcM-like domain-containing protein [Actinobacteria bacterium]|nr:WxcM-like domain-containing protein [Actinomycetota bacterium]